jgi:hypothetical protein
MDAPSTGPALQGAYDRIKSAKGLDDAGTVDVMTRWIRNAKEFITAGDPYFTGVYNQFGIIMDPNLTLPEEEIHAVIEYIKTWQPKVAVTAPGQAPESGSSFPVTLVLVILLTVLLLVALILSRMTNALGRIHKEKEGKEVPPETPFLRSRKFITLVVLSVTTLAVWWTSTRAVDLQRQQGYEPTQPIAFSHQVHAGVNKIDCKYCHVGVERGKQAIIPSVNVCMNCHKTIRKGTFTGTKEIAKIYDAAGFDTLTQTYDLTKAKPIEWVRVHNLPDHVFFSHQQHVKVGKQECTTCHGAVEEMDVLRQDAPLSMGWCLDCHRSTNVQFQENQYYHENYEEYHAKLRDNKDFAVTVEMVGGTECQKCHY